MAHIWLHSKSQTGIKHVLALVLLFWLFFIKVSFVAMYLPISLALQISKETAWETQRKGSAVSPTYLRLYILYVFSSHVRFTWYNCLLKLVFVEQASFWGRIDPLSPSFPVSSLYGLLNFYFVFQSKLYFTYIQMCWKTYSLHPVRPNLLSSFRPRVLSYILWQFFMS